MLLARRMETRTVELYRQGTITGGCYTGIGNEATSVAAAMALDEGDILVPTHRDLGAHLVRGHDPETIALQYLKRATAQTRGRDSGLHLGVEGSDVVGMISHLAHMLPVACGCGWAERRAGTDRVVLTTVGDGATSLGDFHEACNFASVQRLPIIILIENNQYAYSTPVGLQYACERLSDRAIGYGMAGETVDGTDPFAVGDAVARAVARGRRGEGPTLVESRTMRMRGHSEHDDFRYVPAELLARWEAWDPIRRIEAHALDRGWLTEAELSAMQAEVTREVDDAFDRALAAPPADPESARDGVFRRWDPDWNVPRGDAWELP
jgi:TPP-dependent pyruvate/acetoin dehydrogenase alpha subunit